MRVRLLLAAALLTSGACKMDTTPLCGAGSMPMDGHCVPADLGVHDLGTTPDATPDAHDEGVDAPVDAGVDAPMPTDAGDLGVDLGPVYMLDPCLPDGGALENHLHIQADPGSTLYPGGGPVDVVGGTWTQTEPPFVMNQVTISTADLADAGPDASVDLGPYWAVTFAGPSTTMPLAPGRYEGATRTSTTPPSPPAPTMNVSYGGVSCAALNGRFELQTIDTVTGGGYTHVRATFEQTCAGASGNSLRGCIVYSP